MPGRQCGGFSKAMRAPHKPSLACPRTWEERGRDSHMLQATLSTWYAGKPTWIREALHAYILGMVTAGGTWSSLYSPHPILHAAHAMTLLHTRVLSSLLSPQ